MANRYLIKLQPIGKYFFGSENSFDTQDKANGNTSKNYLVRSRQYPQQTTLLGVMRYAILQQYGLLGKENRAEWPNKIGPNSFTGTDKGSNGNTTEKWGLIKSISPLFLINGDDKYIPAGLSSQYYKKKKNSDTEEVTLTANIKEDVETNYKKEGFYWFKDYEAKEEAEMLWKRIAENKLFAPDKIFKESFQVGITKSRDGKSDNDAFYKEFFYQLKDGYAFGFYLETSEVLAHFDKPFILQAGGDQSLFQIETMKATDNIFPAQVPVGMGKFTLLSDAYCNADEVLPLCDLCITESVDFRYIQTNTTETNKYHHVSSSPSNMRKSKKMNLLGRGSVLFTHDAAKLDSVLRNTDIQPYLNIGFNHYLFEPLNY